MEARVEYLKDIQGTAGSELQGRHIALGITGSIAALRTPELARLLMRHGAEVHAVLSREAARLVTPEALEWATGNPVLVALSGRVEHLQLCGESGVCAGLVVAPATANTIAKIALAIDDTPVTTLATTAIGSGVPVLVAPGMHACMYAHPGVQANLRRLEELGVVTVEPRVEEGKAKMAEPGEIVRAMLRLLGPGDLKDQRVLLTAGPTREPLDSARFLTNPSSGRTGTELAREALRRGAEVTLIYGPGTAVPPAGAKVVRVTTAQEMARAVETELGAGSYSFFVGAAAVADFRPSQAHQGKIATREGAIELTLVPTPKILDQVRTQAPDIFSVGFKAEAGVDREGLLSRARARLHEARADLVLANHVGLPDRGFETEDNELFLVGPDGLVEHFPLQSKASLAPLVWDRLIEAWRHRSGPSTLYRLPSVIEGDFRASG
ncbi:MAG: bifunctional phosphopantothenoylcysteine decarboxylase/phosphopantothenate--cysteine ligase CoaBC [Armatimonadetes bacterium]|nr:bifunctional phosphopantothenoylcysteine decarboxylase/phosphopantothenate--cysteine ligase CoaBC [Armatimonadota bacterium]